MKDKILITGSLGQVGSYLCENFLKNNEVIGIDNEVNICHNLPDEVNQITVKDDICNKKIVDKIIRDVDIVIHCAAQINVEKSLNNPLYDAKNNIIGTINLLQSSKNNSIKHFIYFSSCVVYGNPVQLPINENHILNPLSPYGISKLSAEKYVNMYHEIYNLPTTIIRPFNIYSKRSNPHSPYSGVITKFLSCINNKSPIIIQGDGNQTRDFVYISDIIQIVKLFLNKTESIGQTFNCGYGEDITINQLAKIMIRLSRKNLQLIHIKERKGDIKHSYANIEKAKKLLDFKPKIKLVNGIEKLVP